MDMVSSAALAHVGLLTFSAATTTVLAVYAFRHRQEPGATWFGMLMLSLTVWSGCYGVGIVTSDPTWRVFWARVQWFGVATIYVWLFLFALSYTGHDKFVTRWNVVGFCLVPMLAIIGAWTNPFHHLLWRTAQVRVVDGISLIDFTYGPIFWVDIIYGYALIAIATALLLRLVFQSDYLYTDQSALLLVGIAAPFLGNVAENFFWTSQLVIDPTPHAFTVTGITFGYALFRRQLFDLVPATRQLGRNAAISQLDTGVVIVDNARRVVYCNSAAVNVIDSDPADALGREIRSLVDSDVIDFEAEDALAELEIDESVYEVRTSPITDQHDRQIGHTLVIHDVTTRKRRERGLAAQRDELATVNELNAVIRGVNQALVSATSQEAVERAVCERLADSDLYRTACVADVTTWTGDADRWLVAGDQVESTPPALDDDGIESRALERSEEARTQTIAPEPTTGDGTWAIVPVVYGRTVHGVLGLYTDREEISDRERAVLGELGEIVGHAVNAVGMRQLLSAEAVTEVELESTDDSDSLVAASVFTECDLELAGLVPGGKAGHVAYVRLEDGDVSAVADELESSGEVRLISDGETGGLLEWQVTGDALLGMLVDFGANVQHATVEDGRASYTLEIAAGSSVRALIDAVEQQFPDTRLVSKRQRPRAVERADTLTEHSLADLTERQAEALEAAYRAGYFRWPRDSTAEDVAAVLDISAPTLHGHLRKAEEQILTDLFDPETTE
ncbi:histidine kinase N-terminal 7TM domain-containing protein [Halobaculum gomorrense]|uniref:Predicted DNA binding protein, contains HTH domain n=1 Tax=Halobaculum gomorrense TaxID=43928 RepID=A0A1M5KWF2_9EURY|nr:histidine kinase N-terminal 7TM domain-containing protein [Halobaculum gomorrense]SHG56839.1 Predicted DNA binding protein, contains HTH domain [Halobaculum gomorrense]